MAKLRIEKPVDVARPAKKPGIAKIAVALAMAAAAGLLFFFYLSPNNPPAVVPSLEIPGFGPKVEILDAGVWRSVSRSDLLDAGESIRVGESGEADLKLPGEVHLRLKPGTELTLLPPDSRKKGPDGLRFRLERGTVLAATEKVFLQNLLIFETPSSKIQSGGGSFRLEANPETGISTLGVLKGTALAQPKQAKGEGVEVKGLEVYSVSSQAPAGAPRRVSRDEWNQMRELYELIVRTAVSEAEQLDLSQGAGGLFQYVFDHGTFYTPKFGFSSREFYKDEHSGEVRLEIEYDVFPRGSFVGMYSKTRDLDLSKFSHLEFEMRRVKDEGYPQSVRIELKSKSGIVRAFAAKLPNVRWGKYSFPLHVNQETQLSELALVFLHDRVGEHKKGSVELRQINLTEKAEEQGSETSSELHKASGGAASPKPSLGKQPVPDVDEPGSLPLSEEF